MKSEIQALLDKLELDLGVCLPTDMIQELLSKSCISADEFTKTVLLGEGINPETELNYYRTIKKRFTVLYGNEIQESDYL